MSVAEPTKDLVSDIQRHLTDLGCGTLLVSESGSRCFGTHGPQSDHDLKVVFRRPVEDYLSIEERQDTLTFGWRGNTVVAFDSRRAAQFLASGNPAMHELAWSETIHFSEGSFREDLGRLTRHFFRLEASLAVYGARLRKLMAHRDWQGSAVPTKRGLQATHLLLSVQHVEGHASAPPVGIATLISSSKNEGLARLASAVWQARLHGRGILDGAHASAIRLLATSAIARIEDALRGRPGSTSGTADDRQALQDWIVHWVVPNGHPGSLAP